jgi:chromosome segregation ATPase
MLGELKEFFADTLNKTVKANETEIASVKDSVAVLEKSLEEKVTELTTQNANLSKTLADITGALNGVEKRIDAVESETAIKKSSDLGGSQEVAIQKSKWNGSFLGSVSDLIR